MCKEEQQDEGWTKCSILHPITFSHISGGSLLQEEAGGGQEVEERGPKEFETEASDRDLGVLKEGREIAMIIDEEEDETKMIARGGLVVEGLDLDLVEMQLEGTNLQSFVNYSCRENVLKVLKTAYIAMPPNHQRSWNCVNSIS